MRTTRPPHTQAAHPGMRIVATGMAMAVIGSVGWWLGLACAHAISRMVP